jgi:hypothetical protein
MAIFDLYATGVTKLHRGVEDVGRYHLGSRPSGRRPGFVAVHGLLQLRVHFVCDGHNVWQHLAEIHSRQIVL